MAEMMRCLLDNTWLIDINQIFACKSIFKLDVKPAGEGLEWYSGCFFLKFGILGSVQKCVYVFVDWLKCICDPWETVAL